MPTIDLGPCECCGTTNCFCGEHPLPFSITAEVIYLSLRPNSTLSPDWVPTLLGLGIGDQYSGVLNRVGGFCGYGLYAALPTSVTSSDGYSFNPCGPVFNPYAPATQHLSVSVYTTFGDGTILLTADAQFAASGFANNRYWDCHTGRTQSGGAYQVVLPEMQCDSNYTFDLELVSGYAYTGGVPEFRDYYLLGLRITLS